MSSWNTLSIRFDPFGPLKPPLQSVLTVLEVVEAILEALLSIIKAFSLDFLNPLKAIVAIILAAIRSIINQLKSTGFAVLLVHPDFSQSDFGGVLHSVSGAYPAFESKVVAKFHDTGDVFRPTYPQGSAVAMFVLYIGASSPGDLMGQLFALLAFLKHPKVLSALPAPVNLKVKPVNKSGAAISRFKKLFDSDLDKALQLEWHMPMAPTGGNAPGFVNAMVSFYDSFRFPNFVVERSSNPQGATVSADLKSQTAGPGIAAQQKRFNFAVAETTAIVREMGTNNPLKHFETKFPISTTSGLLEGSLTGTYRYLDNSFQDGDRGKTYYYRVRAYFGDPSNYLGAKSTSDYNALVVDDGHNKKIYKWEDGVTMGNPSPIVRGYVPRARPGGSGGVFSLYDDIYRAVKVGILLNFEFPPATAQDSAHRRDQKTGWGTLSLVAGQLAPLKASYKTSKDLKDSFLFQVACRRIANQCSVALYSKPPLADLVASKWANGAQKAVVTVEQSTATWRFVGIKSGFTAGAKAKLESYLALEDGYKAGSPITGPFPITDLTPDNPDKTGLGVDQRQALADFLRTALIPLAGQSKYLSWYSVSIGDVFPAFVPFIFDFEQFILAILGAVKGALEELIDIIQTLISKIQQLEAILQTIIGILNLLKINVTVSILGVVNSNGSADSLAQALLSSENKPDSSPYGLHSGMVLCAGGPGEGAIAALKAIAFILQIPLG